MRPRTIRLPLLLLCAALALGKGETMASATEEVTLSGIKALVAKQVELIVAGKLDELKATFTDRVKDRVTMERVTKAQAQLKSLTIDDLVASVQPTGQDLKVKMKNGRTLTTFVNVGGVWKADTVWFR
jgi:hypothetical protein